MDFDDYDVPDDSMNAAQLAANSLKLTGLDKLKTRKPIPRLDFER